MEEKIRELMQSAVKSPEAAQDNVREAKELEQEAYEEEGCDELPVLDDVLDDIEDRIHYLISCLKLPEECGGGGEALSCR